MTDQHGVPAPEAAGPGGDGPGPEGAGFRHRGAEDELIVLVRPEALSGVRPEGERPAAGVDVSALHTFLAGEQLALVPLFDGEAQPRGAAGADLPDLALFHRVRGGVGRSRELRDRIAELPGIAAAYVKPGAVPAAALSEEFDQARRGWAKSAATPDFTARQGFLGPAPEGVDAHWAWQRLGGSGEGVTVIDVGGAWQLAHESLSAKPAGLVAGAPVEDLAWRNHGTAVLGVLGGDRGAHGITGIAPEAARAVASLRGIGTAAAIHAAAGLLSPGDIVVVALHRPGPRFGFEPREDQRGYLPLEWWPDDFAAIAHATARGVVVVGAAGNGAESLDDAVYDRRPDGFPSWWHNPFDVANRSSGAVLVGAGAPPPGTHGRDHGPDRSRLAFSNHGARVDTQGWGREVTTTGGSWDRPGDLQDGGENAWYTDTFSGTSSAASVVVGVLASLQGLVRAGGRRPLTSREAREVLRATGSPQRDAPGRPASQRIGNRPDLRAAASHVLPSTVGSGRAERYWDELIPYPPELPPRIRLFVAGDWRNLNDPSPEVRQAVYAAFAAGRPEVRVWFTDDEVVGLVVTG